MRTLTFLLLMFFMLAAQIQAAPTIRYFMQAKNATASGTPYGVNDVAGHYVRSGNARLYYEVYGTGKPIFVLHGGGVGSPYELGCIIDELRKDFQVVVVSTEVTEGAISAILR